MKRKLLQLTDQQISDISSHAISAYPKESCGVIKNGGYIRTFNVSASPVKNFRIADSEMNGLLPVEAIVHSHPDGPDCPSSADMRSQASCDLPFVIVATDGGGATLPFVLDTSAKPPSLETRIFRHGVTDCYALIRDWFLIEKNTELMDGPRDWEWWDKKRSDDLYLENYQEAGFRKLTAGEKPEKSDLFFMRTPRARTVNHAGVYLGDDVGFHHMSQRYAYDPYCLPCKFSLLRWKQYIKFWVRHEK